MMNRKALFWPLAAVLLTACEKGLVDDGSVGADAGQVTNTVLQVRTRAGGGTGGDGPTVAYPVQVYVLQGDECRAVQTIGDEGQTLNIALVEGQYTVCAVGGASAADYVLPAADDATATSALTLRDGHGHGDLMTATATATLTDGGTNTVTLGMTRKTMLIQDVTIKKIPTAATAVSVTIAPLWQSLTVGGAFSTAGASTTIALSKQADNRTWTLPSPVGEGSGVGLLPPSSQPVSVSVNITVGGTTKTYTYSCSDELEAGYKINIDGTYTEAVGVALTGTITGATWLGERTVSFEFNESGTSAAGGSPADGDNASPADGSGSVPGGSAAGGSAIPAVGDTYRGCYVLAVNGDDAQADVTLLSPTELTGIDYEETTTVQASIDAALATVTDGDISGWEVPTTDEARLMYAAREDIGNLTAGSYLCHRNNDYRAFKPSDDEFSAISSSIRSSTVLRPVVTISITKD